MVDFAALPPEVNSARMYAGGGSGPLVAAAAAWDRLAAELGSAASSYQVIVAELTGGSWVGPSSAAMAAAVAPYVAWMSGTAAAAERTASQVRAAVAAYEAAFAAVVPPAVVAANRASLASLVASNVLGQNTSAIAANQVQYAEMWTQDAAAMHGYAAGSAAAATLPAFTPAPADSNPAAQSGQSDSLSGLSDLVTKLSDYLSNLGTTGSSKQLLDLLTSNPVLFYEDLSVFTTGFNSVSGGGGFTASGVSILTAVPENAAIMFTLWWMASQSAMGGMAGLTGSGSGVLGSGSVLAGAGSAALVGESAPAVSVGLGGAGASAGLGRAVSVGGLSVPRSWGSVAPEVRLAAAALPAVAGVGAVPQLGPAGSGLAGLGGMPMLGSVVNAPKTGAPRVGSGPRTKVMARMPGETGDRADATDRGTTTVVSVLSERDELNKLRKAAAELAKKRDALTRSAAKLIRQAQES